MGLVEPGARRKVIDDGCRRLFTLVGQRRTQPPQVAVIDRHLKFGRFLNAKKAMIRFYVSNFRVCPQLVLSAKRESVCRQFETEVSRL